MTVSKNVPQSVPLTFWTTAPPFLKPPCSFHQVSTHQGLRGNDSTDHTDEGEEGWWKRLKNTWILSPEPPAEIQ